MINMCNYADLVTVKFLMEIKKTINVVGICVLNSSDYLIKIRREICSKWHFQSLAELKTKVTRGVKRERRLEDLAELTRGRWGRRSISLLHFQPMKLKKLDIKTHKDFFLMCHTRILKTFDTILNTWFKKKLWIIQYKFLLN